MTEVNPTETTAESTSPEVSAVEPIVQSNLDSDIDNLFAEWGFDTGEEAAAKVPAEDPEVDDEPIEVSTDEDEAPVDGDSDTDAGEEEEVSEDASENTSDSVVDWEEMKQHSFDIDGKTYSANDLKAALGRQTKQEEARIEVETARQEIEAEKERITAMAEALTERQEIQQHESNLAQYQAHLQNLAQQREEARQSGNVDEWNRIGMQLEPMVQQYNAARAQLDTMAKESRNKNLGLQSEILKTKGYGEILSDNQRRDALLGYVNDSYSRDILDTVGSNADLIIMAEKARLYDKANAEVPKAKLKASNKTLKAGAVKSSSKPKPQKDNISAAIDKLFGD